MTTQSMGDIAAATQSQEIGMKGPRRSSVSSQSLGSDSQVPLSALCSSTWTQATLPSSWIFCPLYSKLLSLFFFFFPMVWFFFFNFLFVVNFVIHWNEKALGSHVFPIPIPPPTSLPTRSLQVLRKVFMELKNTFLTTIPQEIIALDRHVYFEAMVSYLKIHSDSRSLIRQFLFQRVHQDFHDAELIDATRY